LSNKNKILIGTSGWSYDEWRGKFYPPDLPKSRWLEYYAEIFQTVEINATFYRSFKETTYRKWYERSPQRFKFVLKAPKWITHRKRLDDVDEDIKVFSNSVSVLGDKFGLTLMQLPPGLEYEPERLRKALLAFDDPATVAVEFRSSRWIRDETKQILIDTGSVFCIVDSPTSEKVDWITSSTAYIRLHGRKSWYDYDYSHKELEEIGRMIERLVCSGAERVYVFFNNDIGAHAPKNGIVLKEIVKSHF